MPGPRTRMRGVSLVEAMVALAVMAFGTLAVLGVQGTLRLNGDIAKQRSDALRIAQEALEDARSFERLQDYIALATTDPAPVAGYDSSNTAYTLRRTVVDAAAADPTRPRRKTLVVDVDWADRTGQAQTLRLSALLHGVAPELAGSLAVPTAGAVTRQPGGRHPAIPPSAVPWGEGRSRFDPPGGGGIGWVFDNVRADIVQVCAGPALESCIDFNARLLAGHVRFATDAAPPTGADARVPPGTVAPVAVAVAITAPAPADIGCYAQNLDLSTRAYWCAVPVADVGAWSGQSLVLGLPLAISVADPDAGLFRICRYTPYRNAHPVVPDGMRNEEHPLLYVGVTRALVNQNFLVVRAGDGAVAYDCPPDDVPGDPLNTNTWHHQPSN